MLGHVDPIEGGEFRRNQVYVGGHVPPGPGDLAILMQRFERWLNSEHSNSLHPVKWVDKFLPKDLQDVQLFVSPTSYAALAHYKLVHIHPFVDGNGRTSRLLMNTLLMRAGYPPVIIPKQQRSKYYHFLKLANEGDIRPFVRFIADCTEKTLDLYLWATSDLPQQIPMLIQTENEVGEVAKLQPHIASEFYEQESGSGVGSGAGAQTVTPWHPCPIPWSLLNYCILYIICSSHKFLYIYKSTETFVKLWS